MSSIYHSGYGYSKIICEDVTSWFLNNFFPRHKISVDIIHRGLKKEQVLGYCDVVGENYRPRHFMIELQTDMDKETYIKTLLHELTHLRQWVEGSLRFRSGKLCYYTEPAENWDYENQPHEIEARESEQILYDLYMEYKQGVTVPEVSPQWMPNRLRAV